jgi:hypothetical protein
MLHAFRQDRRRGIVPFPVIIVLLILALFGGALFIFRAEFQQAIKMLFALTILIFVLSNFRQVNKWFRSIFK